VSNLEEERSGWMEDRGEKREGRVKRQEIELWEGRVEVS